MKNILINRLREIQNKEGYVSEESLKKLSLELKIPISQLYGVATFYSMIYTKKQGKYVIELCASPSCFLNGSWNLEDYLKKELKIDIGETTKNKKFSLKKTSCIGCCDKPPAMLLNGKVYTSLTEKKLKDILKKCK
ncbi:Thioredoxin-like [2Fe-2S] ferredoxin [uncultured archaeon]|nr:Thioredoxin-like [2Fe-2S] ferredoxin [uncultured archaeon]